MRETTREKRQSRDERKAEMLTKASAPRVEIDWRILHWLLRYPLQRADDLVVGEARWASRATVYRHLQGLEASRLVESVVPATPATGKRLYHVSNLGLHVLARHLERPARELAGEWQAGEAGLLRVLPRLPVLLVIQDVVNSLITGAAEAMSTQGRRPQLVRWTWQRDVVHRFQYREQAMRLFVDGAIALCIRTPEGDGGSLDRWYGLFLLSTDLDDERLMRLRLERLLCWRESPERWSSFQHMLPVLILAASPRQRDHWQRAIDITALKLRLDPLEGALACLPALESAHMNPWRLDWHMLSTGHPYHLRDLLRPVPPAAFLPALGMEEGEEEERDARSTLNAFVASAPSERGARLVVGNLASRLTSVTRDDLEEREVIALLGLRLTPSHWSMLRLLLTHPLLTDEELAGLLGLQRRSVRCTLYTLRTLECLEPTATEAGRRWHLCGRGLRLMAAANHLHLRNFAVESDNELENETSSMEQRGEAWLLQHIWHMAGVYGFFVRLTQAARQQPGQELCWWETGAVCERRYRVHERWHNLRPDALAEYRMDSRQMRFWLEWDRGTMNVRDLTVKFSSYAHYLASREWAREGRALPWLLCVAPELAQERRMQRVAQTSLAHVTGLVIRTTTVVLLQEQGPLAPIWSPCLPLPSRAVQPKDSLRRCLFETNRLKDDCPL
jgi:protein involved in plasmid replication-relaxation